MSESIALSHLKWISRYKFQGYPSTSFSIGQLQALLVIYCCFTNKVCFHKDSNIYRTNSIVRSLPIWHNVEPTLLNSVKITALYIIPFARFMFSNFQYTIPDNLFQPVRFINISIKLPRSPL